MKLELAHKQAIWKAVVKWYQKGPVIDSEGIAWDFDDTTGKTGWNVTYPTAEHERYCDALYRYELKCRRKADKIFKAAKWDFGEMP